MRFHNDNDITSDDECSNSYEEDNAFSLENTHQVSEDDHEEEPEWLCIGYCETYAANDLDNIDGGNNFLIDCEATASGCDKLDFAGNGSDTTSDTDGNRLIDGDESITNPPSVELLVSNMVDFCLNEPTNSTDEDVQSLVVVPTNTVETEENSTPNERDNDPLNFRVLQSPPWKDEFKLNHKPLNSFFAPRKTVNNEQSDPVDFNFQRPMWKDDVLQTRDTSTSDRPNSQIQSPTTGSLLETGKLFSLDKIQYIKRKSFHNASDGVLLYSGKFCSGESKFKLHSESCLLTSKNHYVARVSIDQVNELDNSTNFRDAKKILLRNLKIEKVLLDDQLQESKVAENILQSCLQEISNGTLQELQHAEDLFQLQTILQIPKNCNNRNLLEAINANGFVSDRLKSAILMHVETEKKLNARNKFLSAFTTIFKRSDPSKLFDIIRDAVRKGVAFHKKKLLEICPAVMKASLTKLNDKQIMYVTSFDLKLFSDMDNALDNNMFKSVQPVLSTRFLEKVRRIDEDHLRDVIPTTSQIYFFLCKSLFEVAEEVKLLAKQDPLLTYSLNEWKLTDLSNWIPQSTLEVCLSHQLKLLLNMTNHFEPGKPTVTKRFKYDFKLFQNFESSMELQKTIKQTNKVFKNIWINEESVACMPDEIHVWICLLDHTIVHMFENDPDNTNVFKCLFTFYMNFVSSDDFRMESLESLRMITHNTLRFVAQTGPYVHKESSLDSDILQKQVSFINLAILENRMTFSEFRDLIEVFTAYWKQRKEVISSISNKLPGAYFKEDVNEIQTQLLQCVSVALEKKVKSTELISFCRVYDELLIDLNDFQFEWFVRLPTSVNIEVFTLSKVVEPVDNKWKDNEMRCYQVTNFKKFTQLYEVLCDDEKVPTHYLIKVIKIFLNFINNLTVKNKWNSEETLTESTQLNSVVLLIASIRSSLMYLKEQPDYICFDRFVKESTKPFSTVINESISFADFSKRVLLIKESFWYIRNLNAIDIETALKLCQQDNDNFDETFLKAEYNRYTQQFEEYMGTLVGCSREEKINHIVSDVQKTVKPMLTSKWTGDFRQHTLPRIIAGLGAVWAIETSKDVASTGQYLKPHCIQILCILRLLSADDDELGVEKHLAQVLTGQGKSLILGLTAAVLALFGHSVQIMCYSRYLASRDADDFNGLYERFSVDNMISYDTFGDVAHEQLSRSTRNARNYILRCLGLSKSRPSTKYQPNAVDLSKSVLLIDEVDVFFTEKFYGNTYSHGVFPMIPGLALIQIKIWDLATQGHWDPGFIRRKIKEYENYMDHPEIHQLKEFINRTDTYTLLMPYGDELMEQLYTNKKLYLHHLDQMISTAMAVYRGTEDDSYINRFAMNEYGMITIRTDLGEYTTDTYLGYYNIFNYFRLKYTNYTRTIGRINNYGYLNLQIGGISFAKLPDNFPLILGVTGTLTTLNKYEKKAVEEHYEILETSVMPSFFGSSNLKFDKTKNFVCLPTNIEWMNQILSRAHCMISAKRSVIVFFENDCKLNKFSQEYSFLFDRIYVLTANTTDDDLERHINDAGIARTITLATRDMGRGVDYKSSVSVERNGGIHVIQTFFSLDVKEETQIKGRTARKDNRGSYELIVCLADLKHVGLVDEDDESNSVSYLAVEKSRTKLANKAGATKAADVQQAAEVHRKTIDFYRNIQN
ncbi:uncharacterized protein LOC131689225 [Topomyia yanbarensis]|uniref:uncharacterized protein LOC131689225 n=1 Tax=Topomyia yanbarensis TaxID=2498891 RepID=UPI00273C4FEF|nr:uncharacterized protein LOC131689225 [Topomyia yanbarensis]